MNPGPVKCHVIILIYGRRAYRYIQNFTNRSVADLFIPKSHYIAYKILSNIHSLYQERII